MIELGKQEKPKVLIVDDESEVLHSLADLLRKDFHVFATTDIGAAEDLLTAHTMFSLVISDQRMPVLTGAQFLARVAQISPDTARVLLTGHADIDAVIEAVNRGQIVQYITKPWDAGKLIEMLKPIAERHHLLQENRQLIRKLAHFQELATDSAKQVEMLAETQSSLQRDNEMLKTAYDTLDKSFWHLNKIQEILPICVECGKVKTSASSWENVVNYLKHNSRFLSHGYCPECYARAVAELKNS